MAQAVSSRLPSLSKKTVDPRFGLVAALNLIAEAAGDQALRQVQFRHQGAYRQQTSHRAARDTPLAGFQFERFTDMVSGVGGPSGDDRGTAVYGARSLRSREEILAPSDLSALADRRMRSYRANSYEGPFGFVDDYVLVEDENQRDELRTAVVDLILAGSDRVDVFLPDDLVAFEDERAIQYIVFPRELTRSASASASNSAHPGAPRGSP